MPSIIFSRFLKQIPARRLLVTWLALSAASAMAEPPPAIYNFSTSATPYNPLGTNLDGAFPQTGLVESGGFLYGVASGGGRSGFGTVFKVATNGTNFATLKSFSLSDGAFPVTKLALAGTTLYGATPGVGGTDGGTIFKINTDGTQFSTLHPLTSSVDGKNVIALAVAGGALFGVTASGNQYGTLFKMNTSGTPFSVVRAFLGRNASPPDGDTPLLLKLFGSQLFGATSKGGTNGDGTIFRVETNGTGYVVLKSFYGPVDGSTPSALVASGNTLFGLTSSGGSQGYGTAFRMNSDGTGFAVITNLPPGANPFSTPQELALLNGTIYGATARGSKNVGGLFKLNTDGTGLAEMASFTNVPSGDMPLGGVILAGNALYGTTYTGGTYANGCVYRFALTATNSAPAPVSIQAPWISGGRFVIRFQTAGNLNYSVEQISNVSGSNWTSITNFTGNGAVFQMSVAMSNKPSMFFRVRRM